MVVDLMLRPKSLQRRLALFLLIPVTALLFAMGSVGLLHASNSLLAQWREAAVLKLQRAAHDVDMRLRHFKESLQIYHKTASELDVDNMKDWVLVDHLRELEGVAGANLTWMVKPEGKDKLLRKGPPSRHESDEAGMVGEVDAMRFHKVRIAEMTSPHYDFLIEHEKVSLISQLIDETGNAIGELEVAIRFDYLLENVLTSGWWQSQNAFLVDTTGSVLICTEHNRRYLGENNNLLELETLKAMQRKPSGTVLGRGHPPEQVSGFYRLDEAPWSLVLVAPGREILAPIVRFRVYYIATGAFFILFILLLIRWVTGQTVASIKEVSTAAERIAQGQYDALLPVRSQDEVGQLRRNFNTMVSQLRERMKLKEALGLAMEVQQSLLPSEAPKIEGFDIAGKSIYCDETGGDYYDFIQFSELHQGRVGIAVGDVAGHGIAPALLMATVRALLRSRVVMLPGSLGQMITDVNRLMCIDTSDTGNFMTLFILLIDLENQEVRWVRAGHEPAIVYDPSKDSFDQLYGNGIALGVDETWAFQEHKRKVWSNSQTVLIGTDGIWETESPQGERFGKQRLRELIRKHSHHSSQELVQAVTDALTTFRQTEPQRDDITLVVVKSDPQHSTDNFD